MKTPNERTLTSARCLASSLDVPKGAVAQAATELGLPADMLLDNEPWYCPLSIKRIERHLKGITITVE